MSGYILCQTKTADSPYFIENISTNIYTLEELCYYLFHNLYLVDETVMNERLCLWIQDELKLPRLAARLRANFGKFSSLEDVLYPVFKEINYLTYEELKVLNARIQKLDRESRQVREKQKGDALMENGMYVHAIQVYQKLLEENDLEEYGQGLTAKVCHNLGCAFSYLFQMEKALEYFRKEWESGGEREALKTCLLALHSVRTEDEYKTQARELGADDDLMNQVSEILRTFAAKQGITVEKEKTDALLEKLTGEYHRGTGS